MRMPDRNLRECFHLEATTVPPGGNEDAGSAGPRDATPPREVLSADRQEPRAAASTPEGHRRPKLEQLKELEAKLKEDRRRLQQLRATLEQEQLARGDGGAARCRTRVINRRINEDMGGRPSTLQYSQSERDGRRSPPQADVRAIDSRGEEGSRRAPRTPGACHGAEHREFCLTTPRFMG